jgi:glycosyltransferase involved in cell wall biosynthesis
MKVVHVVQSGRGVTIRGDQRHVMYLAAMQRSKGYDVAVMTDAPGMFGEFCRRRGMQVVATSLEHMDPKGGPDSISTRLVEEMAIRLGDLHPDLIHCHGERAACTAITAGNKLQIPCLLTLHIPPGPLFSYLRARNVFAVVSLSKALFGELRKSVPRNYLHYVPNGTDPATSVNRHEASGGNSDLIMVGRINNQKGIDVALLALFALRRKLGGSCPSLRVYGDSTGLDYYKEIASVLGLDELVHFNGAELDVLDRHCKSDILLVPSRFETGPLVVLEAMSRGMPIVSSNVGDVSDMIPEARYGRVVPVESIAELADAVASVLSDVADGRFDSNLLIERHSALYTSERMAERIEFVYDSVRANYASYRGAQRPTGISWA